MRWLLALAATVILVLLLELVAQIVLPGIAADHVRDELQSSGQGIDVKVKSFPAVKLIFHKADSVDVHMQSFSATTSKLTSLLQESSDTGSLNASAGTFTDGLLTVHDATLTKQGSELIATAQIDESDLTKAIPLIKSVTPIASSNGTLTLKGTADIAGFQATVPFTIQVSHGTLIASPNLPVVGSLATLTLFSNPHLAIDSVTAKVSKGGFTVAAHGHLK